MAEGRELEWIVKVYVLGIELLYLVKMRKEREKKKKKE